MGFPIGFFQEPSPEQQAEHEARMERARMQYDELVHSLYRFFDELSEEQLVILKKLLAGMREHDRPDVIANYYIGLIAQRLHKDYNICRAHDVNHESELREEMSTETLMDLGLMVPMSETKKPITKAENPPTEPPDPPPAPPEAPEHDPSQDTCMCGDLRRAHWQWTGACHELHPETDGMVRCRCLSFVLASTI